MDKRKSLLKLIWLNIGKFLSSILYNFGNNYNQLKDKLDLNTKNSDDMDFEDLAPVEKIENGDEYFNALDWALKDEKVFNIAIAGPYGSGKSSVIRAYIKKHPSMKIINLSLASFIEDKSDKNGEVQQSLVDMGGEEKIEEGILKQLFYKVDYKKIPQSRYRKLHNVSRVGIFKNFLILTIIIAGTISFFSPDSFKYVMNIISNTTNWLNIDFKWTFIIALGLFVLTLSVFTHLFWWLSSKYKVKELNFSGKTTIAQKEENKESIFNKNMDEIVYFFEATDFDTVFIEDLDRFQSAKIFIKLRELNTILNNYEMIKRKIVFVYAIKDDMFIDKDRTKFFDFIIPIIPIINSTNSGEILLKRLKNGEDENGKEIYKYDISPKYVTQISPYIEDMRMLTNVYNEFVIYKNTLSTKQELNLLDELMMSLMIFKNLYPKDFAVLQLEEGIVKKAFDDKKDFIVKKTKGFEDETEKAVQELKAIESDILANIKELKAAMLFYLANGQGPVCRINVKGGNYDYNYIMSDDFDIDVLKDTQIIVNYFYNQDGYIRKITVDNIETITKASGNRMGYIERYKYLKNSIPERQDEMKKRILELENKIHYIKGSKLQDLIEKNGTENTLSEEVLKNKLLVFLLRNGYIDETYANYMNYFHPNSITKDDMNFILSVRNYEAMEYGYTLTKSSQILHRLLDYEFEQKEIYNFDLLEYLLKNNSNSPQCNLFIHQLADEDKSSWQFINEFIDKTEKQDLFIELIGNAWTGMWNYIYRDPTLTEDRKTFYFKLILNNVDIEQIEKMNSEFSVKQFILENADILQRLATVNLLSIKNLIRRINIVFKNLNCDGVSEELLNFIFDNKYYEINMAMLKNIVKLKKLEEIERLSSANYTVLRKLEYQPLIDYIDENFVEYVNNIVLGIESNKDESIETVISILKKIYTNPELSVQVIQKEKVLLQDFTKCCIENIEDSEKSKNAVKAIWNAFFDTGKVIACWKNIITYWEQFATSSALLSFIEQNIDTLINCTDAEVVSDEFVKTILIQQIDLNVYRKFIAKFKVSDFTNAFSWFSKEQIKIMLDCSYFVLTPERYVEMKKSYTELLIEFILKNKDIFLSNLDEFEIELQEVEELVCLDEISDEDKINIIKTIDQNMLTVKIAHAICKIKTPVEKSIVEKSWDLLPKENRYELFLNQISVYSNDEIAAKFEIFGGDYEALANRENSHNATLSDTDYNRVLMNYLEKANYLTSKKYETKIYEDPHTFEKTEQKFIVGRVKAKK